MGNQETTTMVILDISAAFDMISHDVLTVFKNHFGIDGKVIKWYENYLRPRYFKLCINDYYLSSKELKFSTPQRPCSGANIFTCYCALITDVIPDTITINGFADDHLIRKKYKASNRDQENRTKENLKQQ